MNPDGTDAQSFGFRGNPSQQGAINFAWSAAIQPGTGDIFVANRESDQVQVFSPTGTSILIFGSNGAATGQFHLPQGIAFGPDGTLYVDNSGNDRVERFSMAAGNTAAIWMATYGQKGAGATSPPGDLNNPTGISVAPDGTVWVADTRNNRVQSLSTSGVWTAITTPVGIRYAAELPRTVGRDRRTRRQHLGGRYRQPPHRLDGYRRRPHLHRQRGEHGGSGGR